MRTIWTVLKETGWGDVFVTAFDHKPTRRELEVLWDVPVDDLLTLNYYEEDPQGNKYYVGGGNVEVDGFTYRLVETRQGDYHVHEF